MALYSNPERDFLADLDEPLRQIVFGAASRKRVRAKQEIQRYGDVDRTLMIVQSGRVRLSRTSADGKRTTLAHLGAGDVFGVFALIIGKSKAYDADAESDTNLLVIDSTVFNGLLDREAVFRNHVFRFMGRRLESALQAFNDERSLPLVFRAAKALVYYADADGRVTLTQQALAEQLGVSRNGLGLALKSLADAGLIERHYGSIYIVDRCRLDKELADAAQHNALF